MQDSRRQAEIRREEEGKKQKRERERDMMRMKAAVEKEQELKLKREELRLIRQQEVLNREATVTSFSKTSVCGGFQAPFPLP